VQCFAGAPLRRVNSRVPFAQRGVEVDRELVQPPFASGARLTPLGLQLESRSPGRLPSRLLTHSPPPR